jgi:hypothetical protein
MAFQYSVAVRNAKLDQIETTIGATAVLKIFSGAEPANCAAADPSGPLCTITLPADWMAAAGSGSKAKLGTWSNTASGAGVAASWRIYESTATTCHIQGNTTDMTFDNTNIAVGQVVTVNSFTLTAGNA